MPSTAAACRLILHVNDPAALAAWYCQTFGWTIAVDERGEGWVDLDAGGFRLALHGGGRGKPQHWPKLQVRVADVAAYRAELLARGIALGEVQHWKSQIWSEGQDPEGHTFQVVNG